MRVPSADGEVTTNHNYGPVSDGELEKLLRVSKAEYNRAAMDRREATATMRDVKRAMQRDKAAVFETISRIMEAARDDMKAQLRESDDYSQAEIDKRDASLRMRAVIKKLKDAGVDIAAFKQVVKMEEMDSIERGEHFDAIDRYATILRLWSGEEM